MLEVSPIHGGGSAAVLTGALFLLFLVGLQGPGNECSMSLHRASEKSPFSEIRQLERERTWMVIATATVFATGFLIAAALVALGALR